jgi:ubiquinone/menaquinone biosynthesis C-methylase UbiE
MIYNIYIKTTKKIKMSNLKNYKNLLISSDSNNKTLDVNGKIYHRYMDKIYIPSTPVELSFEDVTSLSEIRLKLDKDVINYDYTIALINQLLIRIPSHLKSNIIDFGCGGGILAEIIVKNKDFSYVESIFSLDGSSFSINETKNKYKILNNIKSFTQVFDKNTTIDASDNSYSSIISSFVMHFNIYESQLIELHRVLKKGGIFVYNDYIFNKNPKQTKKIIKMLLKIGFEISESIIKIKDEYSNIEKEHKIITAIKH